MSDRDACCSTSLPHEDKNGVASSDQRVVTSGFLKLEVANIVREQKGFATLLHMVVGDVNDGGRLRQVCRLLELAKGVDKHIPHSCSEAKLALDLLLGPWRAHGQGDWTCRMSSSKYTSQCSNEGSEISVSKKGSAREPITTTIGSKNTRREKRKLDVG